MYLYPAHLSTALGIACRFVAILGLSATLPAAQHTDPKREAPVFQLRIWTDQKNYEQGQDIQIHVQLTNVSSKDLFVGKDMWTNASPSRVAVYVTTAVGPSPGHMESSVDGLPPHAFDDFPKAVLKWCFLLSPGYSYSSTTSLRGLVDQSELTPRVYRIRAIYSSFGIDYDTYLNPMLGRPDELRNLKENSWKGDVGSNEIEVKIINRHNK
jgi:hypothetical protein